MDWHLAQVNIARLLAPIDSPLLVDFVANLEPVNAAADAAAGFVWRLQSEEGDALAIRAFTWDAGDSAGVIVNMSVWEDADSLAAFVLEPTHRAVLRRRREWFQHMAEAWTVCWWVPAGHRPSTDEAEERLVHLRHHGPTPYAFTLRHRFPAPGPTPDGGAGPDEDDRFCPA